MPSIDVETYGTITAELSEEGADREAILASHGLDEAAWREADAHWQAAIAEAMGVDVETEGVPAILSAFSDAFVRAQQRVSQLLSLEDFARATRALAGSRDISATLAQHGLTLQQFLRANEHWTRKMIADPPLAERFAKMLADQGG